MRKAIEISELCNLDILVIIKDNDTKKFYEYCSGGKQGKQLFTIEKALETKNSAAYASFLYNDTSYNHLQPSNSNRFPERMESERFDKLKEMADADLKETLEPLEKSLKIQKIQECQFEYIPI